MEDNSVIIEAMQQVRMNGLSDDQIAELFDGDSEMSGREALLVAQIQHLEGKIFALTDMLEEMAITHNMKASQIAQITLEKLAPTRKISGDNS